MKAGFFCVYQNFVEIYKRINQLTTLYRFKGLLSLLLWLQPMVFWSQDYLVHLQHLTTREGLASASVLDIKQDPEGFIWMITRDGVNSFDSESFSLYTKASHGLRFNKYDKLLIDGSGKIWLVHGKAAIDQHIQGMDEVKIDILDPKTGQVFLFNQYVQEQIEESDLFFLYQHEDYSISIGDKYGNAYLFKDHLRHLYFLPGKPMSFFYISDNTIWVNRGEYLHLLNCSTTVRREVALPTAIDWLGRLKNGTLLLQDQIGFQQSPSEKNYREIFILGKDGPLQSQSVSFKKRYNEAGVALQFFLDREQRLWLNLKEEKRLYVYNWEEGKQFDFENPTLTIESHYLASNIYFDQKNLAWGCYYGLDGIFILQTKKNKFKNYLAGSGTSVRGILSIPEEEKLLVNTYRGLFEVKRNKSRVVSKFHGLGLYKGYRDSIWTGAHFHSLININPTTYEYYVNQIDKKYFAPKTGLATSCFYRDKKGTLWIGTDSGLYYKRENSDEISPWEGENYAIMKTSAVRHFVENDEGLWIATSQGLFLLNVETNHLTNYDIFPIKDLVYLYQKERNEFWLASYNEGIVKWDRNLQEFTHYTRENGLVDNTIYAIYEDRQGFFWMPTNRGLMRFNPSTEEVISFHTSDGLPHEEFNTYSHYQDEKGNLYFGGINGFTAFHPDSLQSFPSSSYEPRIVRYSELSSNTGELIDQTDKLQEDGKIVLDPSIKAFQVQFTNLDYTNLNKQGYAYRIKGFEKAWNYQEDNTIKINGLPPGQYQLEIKSQDSKKQNSEEILSMGIVVHQPYYKSSWFRFGAGVLFVLVIWGVSRYRIYHLKESKKRLEKEVELRTLQIKEDKALIASQVEELKMVNRTKDRLFAIIGHELRGPFVQFQNISDKLSYLLRKGAFDRASQLGESMDQIAVKIGTLLDNLLYWGLANSNRLPYQPSEVDLNRIAEEIIDLYRELAETKGIVITNEVTPATYAFADPQAVRIVLRNLLGNAVKFTPEGGEVMLTKKICNGTVHLSVIDTGMGIDQKRIAQLFDPQNLTSTEGTKGEKGTGLGVSLCRLLAEKNGGQLTVESTVGKGSTFSLSLPRISRN